MGGVEEPLCILLPFSQTEVLALCPGHCHSSMLCSYRPLCSFGSLTIPAGLTPACLFGRGALICPPPVLLGSPAFRPHHTTVIITLTALIFLTFEILQHIQHSSLCEWESAFLVSLKNSCFLGLETWQKSLH